ncbi:MAG: hypothetical protein DRO90_02415 [Candidatus Altiarchaeales archaeon]|nr:MAG: hypothetical protein DRO90_02415 [Candidatus Altiarchaeales archaeon]
MLSSIMNPWAFLGLLLLIPIIILYLLKPKPKRIRFPTIMFITRVERDRRFRFFPKRFVRDPLLIVQILIILLFVIAIADPYMKTRVKKGIAENVVFIIDSSASMRATDIYPNRFERAKQIVNGILDKMQEGTKVSILLAENVPIIVLKNSNKENAKSVLNQIECGDTPTNIGDAILFAKDMLSDVSGSKEIYLISDFSNTEGMDVGVACSIAEKDGIDVNLLEINNNGENMGIVGIQGKRFLSERDRFYLTFTVRNYYETDKDVEIEIWLNDNLISKINDKIPRNSERLFYIEDKISYDLGIIRVMLNVNDNLEVDNRAFLVIPKIKKYNILLITNDSADDFLKYAIMASPDFNLSVAISPVIPEFHKFDTIIHGRIDKNRILDGMYHDLKSYVESGGNLIILPYQDLIDIQNREPELGELMPTTLKWLMNSEKYIEINAEHEIMRDVIMADIIVKKYYKNTQKNNSIVIAEVGNEPLILYHKYGSGRVVYMGLNPNSEWSNFYYSSSMPVFWFKLIRWINRKDMALMNNFKTGEYIPLDVNTTIVTPSKKVMKGKNLILDEIGLYEVNLNSISDMIAVNLIDESESDIRKSIQIDITSTMGDEEDVEVNIELYPYVLGIVILFIITELILYRRRGYFVS